MLEELKRDLKIIVADEEVFALVAQTHKKLYDALVKEGFSQEQATKIVASQGLGVRS